MKRRMQNNDISKIRYMESRGVESEVSSSESNSGSDSGQFRLSDSWQFRLSDSDSGPTPTLLVKVIIFFS